MKAPIVTVLLMSALFANPANGATLFEESFESGPLAPPWVASATNQGRVAVSADNGPATGSGHLILDDSVSDAVFSAAEATLVLDLSNKKSVVLAFKAKSLGNESHSPPTANFVGLRNYDGVAVSSDGGITWRSVQSLASVGPSWTDYSVSLDSAVSSLGGSFGQGFRIRFSNYDNSPVPLDGLAIDDVRITGENEQIAVVELPTPLVEGTGPHTGFVFVTQAPTSPLTLTLTSSSAGLSGIPPVIIIPTGEMSASFEFSTTDDDLANLARTITLTPSAPGVTAFASMLTILDDEAPPAVTLNLPPLLAEGTTYSNNASLSVAAPLGVPVVFTFASSPLSQVTLPPSVTLAAGQTQVSFTVQATNDSLLDGSVPVTVTANFTGLPSASAQTTTLDNELTPLSLTLPATLTEGTNGAATLEIPIALVSDLVVIFSSSVNGALTLPTSVTIPAGQTSAAFVVGAVNDTLTNLSRTVTVNGDGVGVTRGTSSVVIMDDESPPIITLALPPQLTEGTSPAPTNNATISLNGPAAVAIVVSLKSNPTGDLTVPSTVTIPAGQTQVLFSATALNDTKIDGAIPVTVTATAVGLAPATALVETLDNENLNLQLTLPTTLMEGGTANGTVSISGSLPVSLTVNLATDSGSTFPSTGSVTIPAGSTQAGFLIVAGDNALRDGSRTINFTASATGFATANSSLTVRDNEIAGYRFTGPSDIVNTANPVAITVAAADLDGNVIPNFSGIVNLSLVLPGGGTQSITPSSVLISGTTGWTGNITLPAVSEAPLKLRAADSIGNSGESNPFDVMRVLPLATSGLVWDPQRSRIYASVPTGGHATYANHVVAINPATLQIVGSVMVNQDPGQLVITSGGEALYVALKGNGTVTKIKLSDFTVEQNFAIGTSSYGTLYADDMCAVAGQPNLLVISRYRKSVSPRHDGVAVYDNGVQRPTKTQDHTGSNVIEPSADPTIFFGLNNETSEFGLRRLQLGPTGMTQIEVKGDLISGYSSDIRSSGNTVISNSGSVVDGALLKRLGTLPTSGLVYPDGPSGRVFFLEQSSQYSSSYDRIGAYDGSSFATIRRLTLPATVSSPGDFIRWGHNGLAFRTASAVMLIGSSRLVPSDPPADLATTVQAVHNPASVGQPLTYTVQVTNAGPNTARNVTASATLSTNQTLNSAVATVGTPTISGLVISLALSELPSGATAALTITTTPQIAGSLTCSASANSDALDPVFSNNLSFKLVSVGFQSTVDVVNELRLAANNLIHDPTRGLLWASLPGTVEAPLGKSIVSINPMTGLISDPIPINAEPFANSMALSPNGRYLYLGLTDVPEVHRIDLSLPGYPSLRIPLGPSQWGGANHAQDIEPLDGDGTSFLMAGSDDAAAAIYDGTVMRPTRTGIYSVGLVERTGTPGVFIGYNNHNTGFDLTRLSATASGVTEILNRGDVISGFSVDLHGVGNRLLSSSGLLVDSTTLTLRANLGIAGRPYLDLANGRAYLVNGNALRAFDTETGNATGNLALPTTSTGDWAKKCIRWGLDGFAILGNNDKILIARWSSTIPAGMDGDGDGIADAWEAANYNSLGSSPLADSDHDSIPSSLEYFFGTSPLQPNGNMVQSALVSQGGLKFIRLVFPRRAGLTGPGPGYESTGDFITWTPETNAQETILSTRTVGGTSIETVEVLIPAPPGDRGFVRMNRAN